MSDTRAQVTDWPTVAALRVQFAEQAIRAAEIRQAETEWTTEQTTVRVQAAVIEAADTIAKVLVESAEMGLDVWAVTR